MKKFNQDIQITVSVDNIAKKLLDTMTEFFPHKELLVEAIIGSSLAHAGALGVSHIYNALNGYESTIDFTVGQAVYCKETCWSYVAKADGSGYQQKEVIIGNCIITAIDPFASDTVTISYISLNRNGETSDDTRKVHHTVLTNQVKEKISQTEMITAK